MNLLGKHFIKAAEYYKKNNTAEKNFVEFFVEYIESKVANIEVFYILEKFIKRDLLEIESNMSDNEIIEKVTKLHEEILSSCKTKDNYNIDDTLDILAFVVFANVYDSENKGC